MLNSLTSLCLSISLISMASAAQTPPRYDYCSPTDGNYTTSTTFATNLATVLSDVTAAKPAAGGFYNFTAGDDSGVDQVNGIALCRGDVSSATCNTCLSQAALSIRQLCPNQKEAIVWYNECMLRYSNRSIFGSLEESPGRTFFNTGNVSDPDRFSQQLGSLLKSLQDKAAAGDSQSKFADGSAKVDDFTEVYALVECTPDLSYIDCSNCIGGDISSIPSCCNGKQGAFILNPSCTLRFETYLFYTPSSDGNQSSSAPPPGSRNNNTNTEKGSKGAREQL